MTQTEETARAGAPDVAGGRRILSLWLPFLSTDRVLRERARGRAGAGGGGSVPGGSVPGGSAGEALLAWASVARVHGALMLDAVNGPAQAAGLRRGRSLAEARAQVPALRVAAADPDADARALVGLARAADRYTPLVGLDAPDGLFLDIGGCAALFGGEATLAQEIVSRFRRWGFEARVAIAARPAVAWAVARFGAGAVVPTGQDDAVLASLPVEALRLPEETVAVLHRLGLATVAALLRQPRAPLVQRFGTLLARRIDQALGRQREPITPLAPVASFVAERHFAEPLIQLDALAAVLEALAGRLSCALQERGEGARRLRLRLFHADGAVREALVGASEPLADAQRMTALLKPRLEALSRRIETDSGIDLVRLCGEETARRLPRQGRLDGTEAGQEALAQLVDVLSERLGAGAVQRIQPVDTHQPAQAERRLPAREAAGPCRWPVPQDAALDAMLDAAGRPLARPLKLFWPPEPVETLASVPDGPPVRFVWRRVSHLVAAAEGPERIAPSWWEAVPSERTCDYFRVEDTQGRRFWMFRRGLYEEAAADAPQWFVHGLFP